MRVSRFAICTTKRIGIRRLAMAGITSLIVASSLAVGVPSALAARCSGYGCDGKDPIAMGCAGGARTVRSAPILGVGNNTVGKVELRWSESCGTNWAKVTASSGIPYRRLVANVHRHSDGRTITEDLTGYASIYTNMVYARGICAHASGRIDYAQEFGEGATASAC